MILHCPKEHKKMISPSKTLFACGGLMKMCILLFTQSTKAISKVCNYKKIVIMLKLYCTEQYNNIQ